MRIIITFQCTSCGRKNYTSTKNKKNTTEKLRLKKYCKFCKQHTEHKEVK